MVPSGAVATPLGTTKSPPPQARRKQGESGQGQVSSCLAAARDAGSREAKTAARSAPSTLRRVAAAPSVRASASRRGDGGTASADRSGVASDRDQLSIRWLFMAGSPRSTLRVLPSDPLNATRRCEGACDTHDCDALAPHLEAEVNLPTFHGMVDEEASAYIDVRSRRRRQDDARHAVPVHPEERLSAVNNEIEGV